MVLIKIIALLLFVATGGAIFTEWGKKHLILSFVAGVIAMIGTTYLFRDMYNDFKTDIAQNKEKKPLSDFAKKELKKISLEREKLRKQTEELRQEKLSQEREERIKKAALRTAQIERKRAEEARRQQIITASQNAQKTVFQTRYNRSRGIFEDEIGDIIVKDVLISWVERHYGKVTENEKIYFKSLVNMSRRGNTVYITYGGDRQTKYSKPINSKKYFKFSRTKGRARKFYGNLVRAVQNWRTKYCDIISCSRVDIEEDKPVLGRGADPRTHYDARKNSMGPPNASGWKDLPMFGGGE